MKAFQITGKNEYGIKEISQPTITENEVLVKMKASGICHSDYLLIQGEYVLPFSYPVTPGHEWAGEIVEVGGVVRMRLAETQSPAYMERLRGTLGADPAVV